MSSNGIDLNLTEEQKISMVVRLLEPLKILTESDLEVTDVKYLPSNPDNNLQ